MKIFYIATTILFAFIAYQQHQINNSMDRCQQHIEQIHRFAEQLKNI